MWSPSFTIGSRGCFLVAWSRTQPSETRNSSATSRAVSMVTPLSAEFLPWLNLPVDSSSRPSHGPPVHGLAAGRRTPRASAMKVVLFMDGAPWHRVPTPGPKGWAGTSCGCFPSSCVVLSNEVVIVYSPCSRLSSANHSAICSGVRRSRLYSALGVKDFNVRPLGFWRSTGACPLRGTASRVNRGGLCTGCRAGVRLREPWLSRSGCSPPWKEMAEKPDCEVDPIFFSPSRS